MPFSYICIDRGAEPHTHTHLYHNNRHNYTKLYCIYTLTTPIYMIHIDRGAEPVARARQADSRHGHLQKGMYSSHTHTNTHTHTH
jgi:hypothetical protein